MWYVGVTNHLEQRRIQHFSGEGSAWTKLHKPNKIHGAWALEGSWKDWERDRTLTLMKRYGWEHVRGAGWCQCTLKKPKCI